MEHAIGHPMLGLDCHGLCHRIASVLELRSTVSSYHVALQPARELFGRPALTLTMRMSIAKLRQQTDGFCSPSDAQEEPMLLRLQKKTTVMRLTNNIK